MFIWNVSTIRRTPGKTQAAHQIGGLGDCVVEPHFAVVHWFEGSTAPIRDACSAHLAQSFCDSRPLPAARSGSSARRPWSEPTTMIARKFRRKIRKSASGDSWFVVGL